MSSNPNNPKPFFIDTVTLVPAVWANSVSDLVYDIFENASTKTAAQRALGLGTLARQNADDVQIVGGSINNTPLGLEIPMQGRFSVLSVNVDPIAPDHVVNKRYLTQRIAALTQTFVPVAGGTMTGPLNLYGDPLGPLEAVPRRWVDLRILTTIVEEPIQRIHAVSTNQSTFEWTSFQRSGTTQPSNFLVYIDGVFQTYNVNYTVDVVNNPIFDFLTPVAGGRDFDIVYLNNLKNLLNVNLPPVAPPNGFAAGPGWSNPINLRVNYSLSNYGENQISISHTVLREMFFGCVVTTGALVDRVVRWSTVWFPATPASQTHQPSLVSVSATEAKLVLPVGDIDSYWEGKLEITMLVDGVPTGQVLFMDMTNQITPDYRDGRVRWGFVGAPVVTPVISISNVYEGNSGTTLIPSGGSTAQSSLRVLTTSANIPRDAAQQLWDSGTLVGTIPQGDTTMISQLSLGTHVFVARVVDSGQNVLATSASWTVTAVLPTPTITQILETP